MGIKWIKRRGGFNYRTPWIRRGIRKLPGEISVPLEVPIRRPGPAQLPIPVVPTRGRNVATSTATKYKTQPVGRTKRVRVKTKRGTSRSYRPWGMPFRPMVPAVRLRRRKRNAASMVKIKPMGAGTSFSKYRERKRRSFMSRVMRLAPPQAQLYTNGYRVTNDYSTQASYTWKMMSKGDLTSLIDNISGYGDATRIFIESAYQELFISNQALTNVYIRLYHFVYRRDTVKNPGALITSGLADIYSGTVPTVNTYGITPKMSPSFNAYIKIKRSYLIELGAGRTHLHRSLYRWDREFNNEIVAEGSSSDSDMSYAGWTKGIFMTMHGEPVNDATTKTTVVPSSGAIDIVYRERLNYRYNDPTKPLLEYSTNLATSGVTENVMDSATGAVENQQTA